MEISNSDQIVFKNMAMTLLNQSKLSYYTPKEYIEAAAVIYGFLIENTEIIYPDEVLED